MNYISYLIRKTRLEKDWSQEGLCKDICTTSYLSKIEQGKASPSDEIITLLLNRLGISLCHTAAEKTMECAYEFLFSGEDSRLSQLVQTNDWAQLEYSPCGIDWLLISKIQAKGSPAEEELEPLMTRRQLALQRLLQAQWEEAVRLWPCGYTYLAAGEAFYIGGAFAQAIEYLHRSSTLAAEDGSVHIQMQSRFIIGSCYANLLDLEATERHYTVARRLARALGETDYLDGIDYNIAATQFETGQYEKAMEYFETKRDSRSRNDLHKFAVCCEKLNRRQDALEALCRAETLPDDSPEQVEREMCRTVQIRLTDPNYLASQDYGASLMRTFDLCRKYRPVGFCLFHKPWMVEWYEHHRQYKQIVRLLSEFPDFSH